MNGKYTCNDYRAEMIVLGLRKRLESDNLSEEERQKLMEEIKEHEKAMGID